VQDTSAVSGAETPPNAVQRVNAERNTLRTRTAGLRRDLLAVRLNQVQVGRLNVTRENMMKNTILALSVVALTGALLYLPVSQQSAQAQVLGGLKASAADSGNLVTLVRRGGGGGGGLRINGGGGGGHIARGHHGRAMHAYRGGGRAHVSHPINRHYAGNINRGHWNNGHWNGNRHYGNRYYGYRRYGYWPWIGAGAGAYYYGSTNCDWLYRHNYRRWLAVCQ
jgi:hypothetical protein